MRKLQRTPLLVILSFAVAGVSGGLLLQVARSARGLAPIVPPLSLAVTLLLLGGVLVVLGVLLRRAVQRKSGKAVNPFHAVRLLAGAKAAQFVGALMAGFGVGLILQLLTRSVMAPPASWVPMSLVAGGGVVLIICGVVTEHLCRVPPSDPEKEGEQVAGEPEPDAA